MSGMDIVLGLCISILCICGVSMAMIIRRLAEKVGEVQLERKLEQERVNNWVRASIEANLEDYKSKILHTERAVKWLEHKCTPLFRTEEYKCEYIKEKKDDGNTD